MGVVACIILGAFIGAQRKRKKQCCCLLNIYLSSFGNCFLFRQFFFLYRLHSLFFFSKSLALIQLGNIASQSRLITIEPGRLYFCSLFLVYIFPFEKILCLSPYSKCVSALCSYVIRLGFLCTASQIPFISLHFLHFLLIHVLHL